MAKLNKTKKPKAAVTADAVDAGTGEPSPLPGCESRRNAVDALTGEPPAVGRALRSASIVLGRQ